MADGEGEGRGSSGARDDVAIRAFLIADVRGYTLFTQERGDEAAGKLAGKFAHIAREIVEGLGGTLLELRGDEALCVFGSPRQAIRAAVDLQERFVEETVSDPRLPLTVGIGLDAGEAVAVEGGYRGGALNLAARLCGQARAGEILASREVAHLARRVDGVRYDDRGSLTFKGLAEPVGVVRVVAEGLDAVERLRSFAPVAPGEPRRGRRPWPGIAAAAVALIVIAVGLPLVIGDGGGVSAVANSAAMIDAATGDVRFATPLDGRPGAMATGFGDTWVLLPDRRQVVRLDGSDGEIVDTIGVGEAPTDIVAGEDSVWVADTVARTVFRINPDANEVTEEIPVGVGPTGIALGEDALWVADGIRNELIRLDLASRETRSVDLPLQPDAVEFTPHGVWVTSSGANIVSRVDPSSLEITLSRTVGYGPTDVLAAFGSVWVANHLDGTVSRIDPTTGRVTSVAVGEGPTALAAARGSVWVANEFDASLAPLDPTNETGRGGAAIHVGASVRQVTADGDGIWIAVGESSTSHRGGTLRIATQGDVDALDPGLAFELSSWRVLALTNDGLLAFRKVGGPEGLTLVPDLAEALPELLEGGSGYRFVMRSDVEYASGERVRPEDFRYALERSFRLNEAASQLFASIPGARQCSQRPESCDLRRSVEIDRQVITIHLSEPNPDLPYLLTLPWAFPVPVDTPIEGMTFERLEETGFEQIPATGPYRIDQATESGLVLVRNEVFDEWAPAAQPDGFVDRIEWSFGANDGMLGRIERNELDVLAGFLPPDAVDPFRAAHPDRLVQVTAAALSMAVLNTNLPPFDDERVRRAVNYAIDRGHVQELLGGGATAKATCQILPPGFPGYDPYCPYTRDPGGAWSEADLVTARRLVRQAGAVDARVTYWTAEDGLLLPTSEVAKYIAGQLDRIGLDADLRLVPDQGAYFGRLFQAQRLGLQMFDNGWVADYPGVSGYLTPLFGCDSFSNFGGFCDPDLEHAVRRARLLATVDPASAHEAWAEIDRMLVDEAPTVPLANPVSSNAFSERVRNAQIHPQLGLLLSRVWVE